MEVGRAVTTFEPAGDWRAPSSAPDDVDWPVIITAMIAFVILAFGIAAYVFPQTNPGRYDRCVEQRAETFLGKTDFPVIPAVNQCTVLRDADALR